MILSDLPLCIYITWIALRPRRAASCYLQHDYEIDFGVSTIVSDVSRACRGARCMNYGGRPTQCYACRIGQQGLRLYLMCSYEGVNNVRA